MCFILAPKFLIARAQKILKTALDRLTKYERITWTHLKRAKRRTHL
jgi:hypothetical protein